MTKQEFKQVRRHYKRVTRELWVQYTARAKNEFVFSDATMALYDGYWETLTRFALLVGCSVYKAAQILNIDTSWRY